MRADITIAHAREQLEGIHDRAQRFIFTANTFDWPIDWGIRAWDHSDYTRVALYQ
jgi:hypothetical protein